MSTPTGSAENQVSRPGSSLSARKPASPRKEEDKDGSKVSADKAARKTTKTTPATAATAKSTSKPVKAISSSSPSKQPPLATAKPGPKQNATSESPTEKASPKSAGPVKNVSSVISSKKPAAKEKEGSNGKTSTETQQANDTGSGAERVSSHSDPREKASEPVTTSTEQSPAHNIPLPPCPQGHSGGGDSLSLPLNASPQKSAKQPGKPNCTRGVRALSNQPPAINHIFNGNNLVSGEPAKHTEGTHTCKHTPGSATDLPLDTPTPGSPLEDSWSSLHHQVSPESESGSATTSSDDIKPRSEDYDAGGSQDDVDDCCSNERGESKGGGTMRCHDFLGRSSSDTSTPEELKMLDGGLRVEVRLKGCEVETTSEEEGVKQRPHSWLSRDRDEVPVEEEVQTNIMVKQVPDSQLFSSEESEESEEEDERSEVEVLPVHQAPLPPADPSSQFQGIVNMAFEDGADPGQVNEQQQQLDYQSASNFRRSVLISVDECEELGSEECGVQTPPQQQPDDPLTPCDVFGSNPSPAPQSVPNFVSHSGGHLASDFPKNTPQQQQEQGNEHESNNNKPNKPIVFLTEIQDPLVDDHNPTKVEGVEPSPGCPSLDHDPTDLPPQERERPCHLDLRPAEQYSNGGSPRNNPSTKPSQASVPVHVDCKRSDLHTDLNDPQQKGGSPVHAAIPQSPADLFCYPTSHPILFWVNTVSYIPPPIMTTNGNDRTTQWKTTIIVSTSLQNHDTSRMLLAQHHRIRFSDAVKSGSIVFPQSGIAFLIINPQELPENLEEAGLFDKIKMFVTVHRNSFLLLQAPFYGKKELGIMSLIQHRFLGSNLRVLPVRNNTEIVKGMLTIAKATSKPHVDSVRDRMSLARAHIIESSSVWEMLKDIKLR
ncbi:unnamed protein product [Oncorhynchus mykiss]|uniref:Uncharacterized protein n=1 Tax=Oncorhynchus mykiss TaxID=8022 RepID=A0A060X6X0_ONCMY|nr:unnamed protein product [Oncorhynchus mykiss]